jgi:hypothetical protein
VKLEYRTKAVTMGFLKELEQAQGADRLVYQVTQVVTRWDLRMTTIRLFRLQQPALKRPECLFTC